MLHDKVISTDVETTNDTWFILKDHIIQRLIWHFMIHVRLDSTTLVDPIAKANSTSTTLT